MRLHFSEISDDELRRCELDFIDEKRDEPQLKVAAYQRKMAHYYNAKFKKRSFSIKDLMFQGVFLYSKEPG